MKGLVELQYLMAGQVGLQHLGEGLHGLRFLSAGWIHPMAAHGQPQFPK
jgi:hypothetical protein